MIDLGNESPVETKAAVLEREKAKEKGGRRKKTKKRPGPGTEKKARVQRSFPAATFEEALELADAIQRFAAGHRIRRLTLFENLGKAPDSGHSRALITAS